MVAINTQGTRSETELSIAVFEKMVKCTCGHVKVCKEVNKSETDQVKKDNEREG